MKTSTPVCTSVSDWVLLMRICRAGLVALVNDAARALCKRASRAGRSGEQVFAVAILAVGHVHEGREILPHLVGDHLAL
jgi:hypothetical protein